MTTDDRKMWRNHRTFGYEITRSMGNDGFEYIILDTGTYKHDASRVCALIPVTKKDVMVKIDVDLSNVVENARFLGLNDDDIAYILQKVLARPQE